MELDRLKVFYYVADMLSFSKGAVKLGINQSVVSRHIQLLEKQLGVELFNREKRQIALTREGQSLLLAMRRVFEELEEVKASFAKGSKKPAGPLKIYSNAGLITTLLIDNLGPFLDSYPELEMSMIANDKYPNFSLSEAQVAILPAIPNQTNLVQRYLMSFNIRLYASKDYLKKHGTPKTPEDLMAHRLIGYVTEDQTSPTNTLWHLGLGQRSGRFAKPWIKVTTAPMLFEAAVKGLGIATLARENYLVQRSDLVEVLPDVPGPVSEFYYIYPKHLTEHNAVRVLEEYLRKVIKDNNWK